VPTFGTQVAFTTGVAGTSPQGVAAADLNGDGKLDLAIANNSNLALFVNTSAPWRRYAESRSHPDRSRSRRA
jgi:hypothetical protein